jgi:hypothetical protein
VRASESKSRRVWARRLRRATLPIAAGALTAVAAGSWLAVRGLAAHGHLADARQQLVGVQDALAKGTL